MDTRFGAILRSGKRTTFDDGSGWLDAVPDNAAVARGPDQAKPPVKHRHIAVQAINWREKQRSVKPNMTDLGENKPKPDEEAHRKANVYLIGYIHNK
ncbi:MAG: hypothetical protein HQL37_16280 [Alphaproteobacteria bacterium]|nr:hypothetical protein [Alphaproteobacteria bacterium]